MSVKPSSLSAWMKLVALMALDLALFQGVYRILLVPFVAFLLVALNVVVIRTALRGRGPGAFDAGFLVVGGAYFVAATALMWPRPGRPFGSLGILQGGINLYRKVSGDLRIFRFNNTAFFGMAEHIATTCLGLAMATVAGLLVAGFVRRWPGRGVAMLAGVLQGAILGLGGFTLAVFLLAWLAPSTPARAPGGWVGLVACPIVGGLAGALAARRRTEGKGQLTEAS